MNDGWRYRIASVAGTAALALAAVGVANYPFVQGLFRLLPVVGNLPFNNAVGREFTIEATIATVVVCSVLFPLYKPRPRRILDIGMLALRRVMIALFALATIGYFDFTYRLPRATLLVTGSILFITVPLWFVLIRHRPHQGGHRTIIIGDDPETIIDVLYAVEEEILGYVSPPSAYMRDTESQIDRLEVTDGGSQNALSELTNLGGLSRLDEVLIEYDVETAVLAFAQPDRGEFFGAIDACYEHGVAAKVHRKHADVVLSNGTAEGELIDIELEPWDWLDYIVKRIFDVVFAAMMLVVTSPLVIVIAVAIKLDSPGPILYRQERTTTFGDTFTVAKFRSMVTNAEKESGATLSDENNGGNDPRVIRVGQILRQTHLDEIPQLWSILVGDMSVVGPRPERPELDEDIETGTNKWRSRWFVKPGLTGLAQINHATSHDPETKLRYDIEYIRNQSFWFDLKIVVRQVWYVFGDIIAFVRDR